jgi:hypothetical protein
MTSATTTTPGSILLAGDLSGTATSPALAPTGVAAGAHFPYKIWVDSKGRLLKASDLTSDTVTPWLNTASDTQVGIVKVATGNWKGLIAASSGTISAPAATSSVFGQVKGDGTTVLNESDGTLSLNLPIATTSTKGLMQVGSGLNVSSGVISLDTSSWATTISKGLVAVGTGLSVSSALISLNAPDATSSSKGLIQVTNGNGLDLTGAVLSKTPYYQDATSAQHGIVQVTQANGLTITSGVLAYTAPPPSDATTSTKGIVQVGSGLGVSSGTLSANVATTSTQGILQVTNGNGLTLTGGTLTKTPYYPDATASTKGILQVTNGNGLTISSGILSFTPSYPDATTSTKGVVQVGSGLSVSLGALSIPNATTSTQGILQVTNGNGLDLTTGTLSFSTAGLSVSSSTVFGPIKTGTGITNTSGTITVPVATSSTTGIVTVGQGLSVDGSGVLSSVIATTSLYGIFKVGATLSVSTGVVDIASGFAQSTVANTWAKAQCSSLITRSSISGSTDINPSTYSDTQLWNLTGNVIISNPTTCIAGGIYTIYLKQDATGSRTASFGSYFKTNGTITLTSTANAYDMLQVICISSTEFIAIFSPDWT